MSLPEEIVYKILQYLDLIDQDNFLYLVFPQYYYLIFDKKEKFISNFSDQIIELFGGLNKMLYFPILNFETKFVGVDYIDNILMDDVFSNIMIGIDNCKRPFITIKYKFKNKRGWKDNLETFFQRYTGEINTWTNGTNYYKILGSYGYFLDRGILNDDTKNRVKYLLNNNNTLDLNIV